MLQWTHFYKALCADKQVFLQREKQEELPGHKRRVHFEFWSMSVNCSPENRTLWNFCQLWESSPKSSPILHIIKHYKSYPRHGEKWHLNIVLNFTFPSLLVSLGIFHVFINHLYFLFYDCILCQFPFLKKSFSLSTGISSLCVLDTNPICYIDSKQFTVCLFSCIAHLFLINRFYFLEQF